MEEVIVERSDHGPFERIALTIDGPPLPAQLSVYRSGGTLFDSGGARVASALIEALRDTPPRRVILTHQHEDHAGGVGALRAAFGPLPVFAPAAHVEILKRDDPLPAYRLRMWGAPTPILDACPVHTGARLECDGVTVEAVATPGHTPGHLAYVAEDEGRVYALTGDLYLGGRPVDVWWESAAADQIRSCRELAGHGEALTILPTHGKVREDGAGRLLALASYTEERAARVEACARELGTRDYWRIADACLGTDPGMAAFSRGEFSRACFVRAVLDPVRSLPATPVRDASSAAP